MAECLQNKIEEELECSLCLERLKDPRMFPRCQHSYCYECIVDLCKEDITISCPECRTEVEVGNPPDLSHFKRNHRVNNILECIDKIPISKDLAVQVKCDIHLGEEYRYFCETCEIPACKDCALQEHRTHEYCPINDIASDRKEELLKKLVGIREQREELNEAIKHLEKMKKDITLKNKQVQVDINKHFNDLEETLKLQQQKLVKRADQLTEAKLQIVDMKIDELRLTQGCLQSNIHVVENNFEYSTDGEILRMEKHISESFRERSETITADQELEHVAVYNDMKFLASFDAIEDFKKSLADSHIVVNDNVCVEKCVAWLESKQLKKGNQATITVVCKDENDNDVKHGGQIIKAKFSGNAKVHQASEIDHKNGTHDIDFVPTTQGQLIATIYINNKEAPNCMLKAKVLQNASKSFQASKSSH